MVVGVDFGAPFMLPCHGNVCKAHADWESVGGLDTQTHICTGNKLPCAKVRLLKRWKEDFLLESGNHDRTSRPSTTTTSSANPDASSTPRATLYSLPPEIIAEITRYLSRIEKAMLALVHPQIAHSMGTMSWKELQGREKTNFLRNLSRDLPGYFLCRSCHVLHRRDFGKTGRWTSCNGRLDIGFLNVPAKYSLHPAMVEMTLSRHFSGPPHGCCREMVSCVNINYAGYLKSRKKLDRGFVAIPPSVSVQFRRCQLLLRATFQLVVFKLDDPNTAFQRSGLTICKHISWQRSKVTSQMVGRPRLLKQFLQVRKFAKARYQAKDREKVCDGCDAGKTTFQCAFCPTEFGILWVRTINDPNEKEYAGCEVTVRKSFGSGPWGDTNEWERHFLLYPEPYQPRKLTLDWEFLSAAAWEETSRSPCEHEL